MPDDSFSSVVVVVVVATFSCFSSSILYSPDFLTHTPNDYAIRNIRIIDYLGSISMTGKL